MKCVGCHSQLSSLHTVYGLAPLCDMCAENARLTSDEVKELEAFVPAMRGDGFFGSAEEELELEALSLELMFDNGDDDDVIDWLDDLEELSLYKRDESSRA